MPNKKLISFGNIICDLRRIRTPNPQSRNLIFYPVELWGLVVKSSANVRYLCYSQIIFTNKSSATTGFKFYFFFPCEHSGFQIFKVNHFPTIRLEWNWVQLQKLNLEYSVKGVTLKWGIKTLCQIVNLKGRDWLLLFFPQKK